MPGEPANLAELLGIEMLDAGPDPARARLAVTPGVCQPYGIVHGGTFASIAETVCSWATYEAVKDDGMLALGMSNQATFLRPISAGTVHAEATAGAPPGSGTARSPTTRAGPAAWCG